MSIHQILFDYFGTYPNIDKDYTFNFADVKAGTTVFRILRETVVSQDILGNRELQYDFDLSMFSSFDTSQYGDNNQEKAEEMTQFIDWIEQQEKIKNYPTIGADTEVTKVSVDRLRSGFVGVDPTRQIAQYKIFGSIRYKKIIR